MVRVVLEVFGEMGRWDYRVQVNERVSERVSLAERVPERTDNVIDFAERAGRLRASGRQSTIG